MICPVCQKRIHKDKTEECSVCGQLACFDCLSIEQTHVDDVKSTCTNCIEKEFDE